MHGEEAEDLRNIMLDLTMRRLYGLLHGAFRLPEGHSELSCGSQAVPETSAPYVR
jgi:hypothetical protein